MVAFLEELNVRIFLQIVLKGKLLYFNAIYPKELMTHLQGKKLQVKVLWYKDSRQVSLLSGKKKVVPK